MPKIIKFKPNPIIQPTVNKNSKKYKPENTNELHLYTSPGLGDILWLLNKVYDNTDKDIHIHSFSRQVYSSYLLNNLPKVKSVTQWNEIRIYAKFLEKCRQEYSKYNELTDLNNINEMYIEMNTHVDSGNRIETYLPKLKTTFNLPWQETQKDRVDNLLKEKEYIILYTSSIANNNIGRVNTGKWSFNNYIQIINSLKDKYKLIWIGSTHDQDALIEIQKHYKIDYFINEPLDLLIPLMKQCKAFIGYQSGLNCITIQGLCPTYMLYYNKLTKLPYQICSPDYINNPNYYPEHFDNYNINKLNQWIESV